MYSSNTPTFPASTMSQRMVEIPVHKDVREKLKIKKGIESYSTFLEKIADGQLVLVKNKHE